MKYVYVRYLDGDIATSGFLTNETPWSFTIGYEDGFTETFSKIQYKYEVRLTTN